MRLALPSLLALAALWVVAPGVARARPALDARQVGQLTRYDVVLFSEPIGSGLIRHRAVGMFNAPPKEVFRVATGYEHYGEYIPRIESRVMSRKKDEAVVRVKADLPWPMRNVWVDARYHSDLLYAETYRVRFGMVGGNMLRYEGSLLIEPFGQGRTTVTYELLAEPNSRLPTAWVQRALGRTAFSFVHYLRSRVGMLQRQAIDAAHRQAPVPAVPPAPVAPPASIAPAAPTEPLREVAVPQPKPAVERAHTAGKATE